MKVAIVGAGIIGVATACRLKESLPDVDVVVIAKDFTPNTVSDVAAGFWEPFCAANNSEDLLKKLSEDTYDYVLEQLKSDPASGDHGLMTTHGYNLSKNKELKIPYWKDIVLDFHVLTPKDLSRYPDYIKSGFGFTTVFIESLKYIPWLSKRFKDIGGTFVKGEVKSLEELGLQYHVVVNCTGFGAKQLVNDQSVYPVRGQILKVKAPWIREFVMVSEATKDNKHTYILPNQNHVILGGCTYENDYNTQPDLNDQEWIVKSTSDLVPSLKNAEYIADCVGLRPARDSMRLEREDKAKLDNGISRTMKIVHNYGHGGSGVTVHWGCAGVAVQLITECIEELNVSESRSCK